MDTPDDSHIDNAENGNEGDLENRSATMHDTRKGLTLTARVDEDHTSMGGFLTSRRELETLPPGEPRFLHIHLERYIYIYRMTFDLFLISVYSATSNLNYGRFSPVSYTALLYLHNFSAPQSYILKLSQKYIFGII